MKTAVNEDGRKILKALEDLHKTRPELYEALGIGPMSANVHEVFNDCLEAIRMPNQLSMAAVMKAWVSESQAIENSWLLIENEARRAKLQQMLRRIEDDTERTHIDRAFRVIIRTIHNMGERA